MAQNVVINGATYPNVPSIEVPLSSGQGNAFFMDTSDATATAGSIMEGYTAYAGGAKVTGTASGGGGDDGSFKDVIERTAVNPILPSDLTKIGDYAFYECLRMQTTGLPPSVTKIGLSAFYNCVTLALSKLPDGVTSIGSNAFYQCSKLAISELPTGLTSVGRYAFYGCSSISSLNLPASLSTILSGSFQRCTSLTQVTFSGTPTSISSGAFNTCSNLTTINVPWAEGAVAGAPWGATNATINYNYVG